MANTIELKLLDNKSIVAQMQGIPLAYENSYKIIAGEDNATIFQITSKPTQYASARYTVTMVNSKGYGIAETDIVDNEFTLPLGMAVAGYGHILITAYSGNEIVTFQALKIKVWNTLPDWETEIDHASNIKIEDNILYFKENGIWYSIGSVGGDINLENGTGEKAVQQKNPSTDSDNPEYTGNTASGDYAVALNYDCIASGERAFATGNHTQALGGATHTEGNYAKAVSDYCHAEGGETIAGDEDTPENGKYAHAEGTQTVAKGYGSHAEGQECTAEGNYSHAGGQYSFAKGIASFVHGIGLTAHKIGQTIFGKKNARNDNALLLVGNGGDNTYSNAFEVLEDGTIKGGKSTTSSDNALTLTTKDYVDERGITEISDSSVRICNLDSGIYKLTRSNGTTIYYNGATSTLNFYIYDSPVFLFIDGSGTSSNVVRKWHLFSNKEYGTVGKQALQLYYGNTSTGGGVYHKITLPEEDGSSGRFLQSNGVDTPPTWVASVGGTRLYSHYISWDFGTDGSFVSFGILSTKSDSFSDLDSLITYLMGDGYSFNSGYSYNQTTEIVSSFTGVTFSDDFSSIYFSVIKQGNLNVETYNSSSISGFDDTVEEV